MLLGCLLMLLLCAALWADDYAVPPPVPAETQVQVGAYIFPGWSAGRGDSYGEWKLIAKFANPRPLLGFYDDALPEVADWHINWALEAGISWFAFDWYWHSGEKHLHHALESGFLNARYNEQMRFCIHWCNHPVGGWPPVDNSAEGMEQMIRYAADNYFTRPNYLLIEGRPVFMIWRIEDVLEANGGAEAFTQDVLPRLNAVCRRRGLGDLFIVLVNNNPERVADMPVGDAFTGYSYAGLTTQTPWSRPGSAPYAEMVEALPPLWERLHHRRLPFITSTQSGWDDMPRTLGHGNNTRWARTDNTPDLFERTLREGKALVKPGLPFFLIEAWNEWGEGSYIEPSKQFAFAHLDAIRRVFAPDAPAHEWALPTPEQVDSYSILEGEALAAARAREHEPDPPPTVRPRRMDLVVDPPDLPGRVVAEWRFDDDDMRARITVNPHAEFQDLRERRAAYLVTGNDPQFYFRGEWDWDVEARDLAVAFRIRTSGGSAHNAQLFWATEDGRFSEEQSHRHNWRADGQPHTYLLTFRPEQAPPGRLTAVRLDPPWGTGAVVELEWVRLLAVGEAAAAHRTTYTNPLSDIPPRAADPHVIRHEGLYYLYPTLDSRGYEVYVSRDLIHWEHRGKCFTDERGGVWAPDVFHHRRGDGRFYLYYTADNPAGGKLIGVAVADHPLGPFEDIHDLVEHAIDAHLFEDDDGALYLYYADLRDGFKLAVRPMSDPVTPAGEPTVVLRPEEPWERRHGHVIEGPWMLKREGVYYLMYSGSGAMGPDYAIGYATSHSPLGPFTRHPGNPIAQRGEGIFGPGHHCVVAGPDGRLWMLYHHKNTEQVDWDRFVALDPLWFDEAGVINVTLSRGTPEPGP